MKISQITFLALLISVSFNGILAKKNTEKNALIKVQKNQISKLENRYKNEIHFVWEGLEKDIPKDGDVMLNLTTDENTVYINPVDN